MWIADLPAIGHDLTSGYVVDRMDPFLETLLELNGVQPQSAEPVLLGLAEHLYIHP